MLTIRDISVPAAHEPNSLLYLAARQLRLPASEVQSVTIRKRSVDARKKDDIRYIYTVDAKVKGSENRILKQCRNPKVSLAEPYIHKVAHCSAVLKHRPVIVGFGPGGMFAALVLALAGLCPIVIERGCDADTRQKKVQQFWKDGTLDTECNVQFGEGGAGTFSDGKLNTGTSNKRGYWVLQQLVAGGANEDILYDAKPHVGTDILVRVVHQIRKRIESLGGEVFFETKLTGLEIQDGKLCRICTVHRGVEQQLACDNLILAIGHSARDTFAMLESTGIPMEPKPFSMGVRIEHLQSDIDKAQYGIPHGKVLPPADYKLNVHLPDGSSAYTFCMCPGGYVVAAASEAGGIATNGMSNQAREGENANAAVLVTLKPEDFPDKSVLGGVRWQQEIERAAFIAGGSNYRAPAQTVGDFLAHRPSSGFVGIKPTYLPGVTPSELHGVLPKLITDVLEQALPEFSRKLHGFNNPNAVLTAPESRSSSPVRIVRDDKKRSAVKGLYPCGEGAGYAGGIMSAAVDGMLCAESLLESLA